MTSILIFWIYELPWLTKSYKGQNTTITLSRFTEFRLRLFFDFLMINRVFWYINYIFLYPTPFNIPNYGAKHFRLLYLCYFCSMQSIAKLMWNCRCTYFKNQPFFFFLLLFSLYLFFVFKNIRR